MDYKVKRQKCHWIILDLLIKTIIPIRREANIIVPLTQITKSNKRECSSFSKHH